MHPNLGRTRISPVSSYPTPKRSLDKALSAALLVVLSPLFAFLFVAMGLDALLRRRATAARGSIASGGSRAAVSSTSSSSERSAERSWRGSTRPSRTPGMHEADESNLTWAGRRLLKPRYLDELPQIWNVFRGDMSLVGPRPWPPPMVATQVAKGFTYRNEFVAGWTGPAQVEKGVTESSGYAVLDLAYVDACRSASAWQLDPQRSRAPPPHDRRHGEGRRPAILSSSPVALPTSRGHAR